MKDNTRADDESRPGEMPGRLTSPVPSDSIMLDNLKAMWDKAHVFDSEIAKNMESLKGAAIPGFNLPWWVKLVPSPFRVNFRKCVEIKVQNEDFLRCLEEGNVIPPQRLVAPEIWHDIEKANFCRVYELGGWGCVFHVYSFFVSHVAVEEKDGAKRLVAKPADVRVYDTLTDFIKWWKRHLEKPNCTCLSICSFGGWDEEMEPVELPDSIQVLSSPRDNGTWDIRHNSLEHMRPIYRTLVYRLYPESWVTWHGRICEILKEEFTNNPSAATMTPSRMKDRAHIPLDCIKEIFEDLRRNHSDEWRSARHSGTDELGLLPANGNRGDGSFVRGNVKFQWIADGIGVAVNCVWFLISRHVLSNQHHWQILWVITGLLAFYLFKVMAGNLERRIKQ